MVRRNRASGTLIPLSGLWYLLLKRWWIYWIFEGPGMPGGPWISHNVRSQIIGADRGIGKRGLGCAISVAEA